MQQLSSRPQDLEKVATGKVAGAQGEVGSCMARMGAAAERGN